MSSAPDPSATNPSATNPPATNPSASNPSATNPPATNPSASNPSASSIQALAESAKRELEWREVLRDIRDLERWRELFFDLNIAKGGLLMLVAGAAGILAGLGIPQVRESINQRIGMTTASGSEKAARQVDLDTMAARLKARGYKLHPDRVRGHVQLILQQHSDLEALRPLHAQLSPTDRFHEHEFGQQLGVQLGVAERRSETAARRFGDAIEPLLADMRTSEASDLRTRLELNAGRAELQDRELEALVLDGKRRQALIGEIADYCTRNAAGGAADKRPEPPQFAPNRTIGSLIV